MSKKSNNCKIGKPYAVILAVITCIFIVLCAVFAGVRQNPVAAASVNNDFIKQTPLISAHRAGRNIAPENTLMAFETCIASADEYKIDVFEFDLHLTADNELVLLHDDTLDRTSNSREVFGKRNVKASDCTLEELSRLNFGYNYQAEDGSHPFRNYTEETLPDNLKIVTLKTVLNYLETKGDFYYIIEIKNGGKKGEQATDELVKILNEKNCADRAIIGTFHTHVSKYMTEKYPQIMRSAGTGEVFTYYLIYYLWQIDLTEKDLGYRVLQIPDKMIFNFSTDAFIEYAHRNGFAIQYWTINDADTIKELAESGADCIITDNPDIAYNTIYKD